MQGQAVIDPASQRLRPLLRITSERTAIASRPARLSDVGSLALLIVLALVLRSYLLWNTEVAARDSIGYIRYAWQLKQQPWQDVLRHTEQPPLYALALLGMSVPLRQVANAPESILMQTSAQFTSVVAGVLLVLPMFLLGKELFDRNVGFWAALLFQCLPGTGRFLSDGVSEAMFLMLAAFSLWFAVRALRMQSMLLFALSGLFAGLTYLTRTEGGLVAAATGIVLLGCQAVRSWRFSWKRWVACAAALSLGALIVAGPYMAVIGGITLKTSILNSVMGQAAEAPLRERMTALPLAVWWSEAEGKRTLWGLWALGTELVRGAFYVGWAAAIVGLLAYRHRLVAVPGIWVLLVLSAGVMLALWGLANSMGYLSDRHCLLILLCSMFWIVAGFRAMGGWLAKRIRRYLDEPTAGKGMWRQLMEERLTSPRAFTAMLLMAFIGAGIPKTLEPLHCNRAGLRQAGLWLLANAQPGDRIVDPYCWAHYYAGCVFREGLPDDPPPGHRPVCYVVLEQSKSDHRRLTQLEDARRLAERGEVVYRWAGKQGKLEAEVLVFAVR
jgi:hypothetical protein